MNTTQHQTVYYTKIIRLMLAANCPGSRNFTLFNAHRRPIVVSVHFAMRRGLDKGLSIAMAVHL